MITVDKVIYDALVKRQNVVLPGVGSLEVKRRRAKMSGDRRIIPPQNVISFVGEEIAEGESVVVLLASAASVGKKEAREMYDSWLEGAGSEKGVAIEGVGTIRDGKFVIDKELHAALNPAGDDEPVVMKKDRGGPLWIWILIGLLLAFLAFFLLSYYCGNGLFGIQRKPKQIEIVAPAVPQSPANGATAEETIIETLKQSAPEPAFHIIAGSFSVEANADSYAAEIQRQFPELSVQKIRSSRNGNWLVSIFNAPTERQAYNKMNMYWDISLDLWVYEQK